MASRGKPVSQLDGSTYAHHNCVLAVTKKLMDLWTLGFWNPSVKSLRVATGDTSGGVNYTQAIAAAAKLSSNEVLLKGLYNVPTQTMRDLLTAGKEFGIAILCSVTVNTPYATGSYRGGHLVAVLDRRTYTWTDAAGLKRSQEQGLVMDPGRTTARFVWWPWSLLVKAALAHTSGNGVHLLAGRDRKNVTRPAKIAGAIRSTTAVVENPTNVVGSFTEGQGVLVVDTADGSAYPLQTRTLTQWNKLGPGKYAVAKIR